MRTFNTWFIFNCCIVKSTSSTTRLWTSWESNEHPVVVMDDETWKRQKNFNFLQPAWSVTAAALVLYVSFSALKSSSQFKYNQMLTGASVYMCEICAGQYPTTYCGNFPMYTMFPLLSAEKDSIWKCIWNNRRKAKDGENNMRGDEVWGRKEMIHVLQTDKLLEQQRQADRAADKSKDKAFGSCCGWSAEKANENFPAIFFFSFLIC